MHENENIAQKFWHFTLFFHFADKYLRAIVTLGKLSYKFQKKLK